MTENVPASADSPTRNDLAPSASQLAPYYFGQLLYYEKIEAAAESRPVMARIALTIAGYGNDYPVLLGDVIKDLSWENYLATLSFLTLASSVHIAWSPVKMRCLRKWAEEMGTGSAP